VEPARAALAPPAQGHPLSVAQLRVQLANGARAALRRVAAMSQPGDDAADLGQRLPVGLVRDVACTPPAGGSTRCWMRWDTAGGTPRTTTYAVLLTHGGCFRAAVRPPLATIYDTTIRAYAEHPLNELTSLSQRMLTARAHLPFGLCGGLLALALLGAGCGGDDPPTAAQPPAQPLSARNPISGSIPRATSADFRAPIRRYRRYVERELAAMSRDVAALQRSVAAGDGAGARAAWRASNERYQSIGAAYGAFGELDRAVSGTAAGLQRGVRDPRFTGLHRVELALFGRHSTVDARRPTARLAAAVARMRRRVHTLRIDPLEYALRSHEIIEDTLHLQLTRQASLWSGAVYDAVGANVRGARVVLETLRGPIDRRDPGLRARADRALARVTRALAHLRRSSRGYPDPARVAQRDRERIAALVAGAAEELAFIPELIDPRPPLPARGSYGVAPS
jgi:hypothetical protein